MTIPCQCYDGRWENYQENEIGWDNIGRPLHVTEFIVCMNCNESWSTRWLIGNLDEMTVVTTEEAPEEEKDDRCSCKEDHININCQECY